MHPEAKMFPPQFKTLNISVEAVRNTNVAYTRRHTKRFSSFFAAAVNLRFPTTKMKAK